jgi:hypothetical protein
MKKTRRQFLRATCLTVACVSFLGVAKRALAKPRAPLPAWDGIARDCVVTCPTCKKKVQETMSSETIKKIYHCPNCLAWLSPKKGDHCIYDSYGSVKCPVMQLKARKAQNLPI